MSNPGNPFGEGEQAWSNSSKGQGDFGNQSGENSFESNPWDMDSEFDSYSDNDAQETQYLNAPVGQFTPPDQQTGSMPAGNSGKSNGPLIGGIAVAAVAVIALFVGLIFLLPKDSDSLEASDSSTSASDDSMGAQASTSTVTETASASPRETATETMTKTTTTTATKTQSTSPGEKYANLSGREFAQRAFSMDRDDLDPHGWTDSTARCSGHDYARFVVETVAGYAVICEKAETRDQYYLGDYNGVTPDAYEVTDFSNGTWTATHGNVEYVVNEDWLVVYENGENIFEDEVVDSGTLQAG